MNLPGAERAFIDPAKVRDYLLNPDHPVGHSKARFFGALGFTRARWPALYRVPIDLAVEGEATKGEPSPYGQKYEIHATITGPAEREAYIVTVWIVLLGEDFRDSSPPFQGAPMTQPFRELDSVVLVHDLPEAGLCAGDLGAVVHVHAPTRSRWSSSRPRDGWWRCGRSRPKTYGSRTTMTCSPRVRCGRA